MGAVCDGLSWACFIYISYLFILHAWIIFCKALLKSKTRKRATHTQTHTDWDRQMWENQNYLFDLSAQWCQLWDGVRHQQNFLSDTDKRRQRRGRVSVGSTLPIALSSFSSRGLSALTTHLIWQTCAVLKQGATTDCGRGSGLRQRQSRRRQQAAGSRQQATCEWWHFACLPSRRQRLRLRTKYWWGCSLCWSTWRLADGRHVQSMQHFLSIDINQRGKETAREGHCVPTLVALLMWLMLTLKDAQRQTDRQTERDS